jgi:protein-disulfide isomerase
VAEQSEGQGTSGEKAKSPKGGSGQANLGLYFAISLVTAIAVVAVAAGINHAWPIFGTTSEGDDGAAVQNTAVPGEPTAVPVVEVDVDDDPSKGPKDAPVTIIEFSDFQCPYCARFAEETLPQILENYGDKVLYVYRDYPLTQMHTNAQKAAEAGECAHEQGAFFEYHYLMFENQDVLDVDSLKGYAASLSLDTEAFNECLDSGKYADEVEEDLRDGQKAAIEVGRQSLGTPTFFINGIYVSGAYPYDENSQYYQAGVATFKQMIEEALAEAGE